MRERTAVLLFGLVTFLAVEPTVCPRLSPLARGDVDGPPAKPNP